MKKRRVVETRTGKIKVRQTGGRQYVWLYIYEQDDEIRSVWLSQQQLRNLIDALEDACDE